MLKISFNFLIYPHRRYCRQQKNFISDLRKLTIETQENNVSFNQVSKLAQTLKKTLHYKGLRGVTKSAINTYLSCLSTVFLTLYGDIF